jgi:hypothetical protein
MAKKRTTKTAPKIVQATEPGVHDPQTFTPLAEPRHERWPRADVRAILKVMDHQ